ncbi:putative membrane protein YbfM [Paenibacillus marchantiophytorum]|uniref:Membrane protein YbfM n=1 Tax=Paenibacillus marchantiophytorum TaxID=1619310 RepID=A0ABQ2BQ48_9BACL|nr:putative membrane protein YbfM [Paenibacillus marchantiophytorum]
MAAIAFLQDIIIQYGYIAIFFCLALGIIGLPVPDEILMTIVGYLSSMGLLLFPLSLAVSFFGAMTGMLCSYALGRKFGKPLLWKYGKWIKLTSKRLEKTETWFERYGPWAICIGYYIPGLRHLTCYLAGVSAMSPRKYLLYSGMGAMVWCAIFISIGYFLGASVDFSNYHASLLRLFF